MGRNGGDGMSLSREEQSRLLACMLDMGELLLDAGAEISRVEDTLERMGRAYGAARMDVLVITAVITLTMAFPGDESTTETRRIRSTGQTDFSRLERLNALSRQCCAAPLPLTQLRREIDDVATQGKPASKQLWGSVLLGGSFAVFFGGSLWDGLVAAAFAGLIFLLQDRLGRTKLNTVAFNLLVSLIVGLGVGLVTAVVPALHMDMILIGDIMLLIPGLAITNAVRNLLVGDTISGVMRLAESLIWAGALAGGFMVALMVVNALR